MEEMRVYIIWGFLGSGKTTLINHLLSTYWVDKRVVIIENESGTTSVDSLLLRSKDYHVWDITSGCVCCTLRHELPRVIKEIKESVHPDLVLVEPSGLASLEDLIRMPELAINGFISLVDVGMYPLLRRLNPTFYQRQFALSPVIVLTKTERVEADEVEAVREALLGIQNQSKIVSDYISLCKNDWDELWAYSCHNRWDAGGVMYAKVSEISYGVQTISVTSPFDSCFFEQLFNRINNLIPKAIIRAKGVIPDSGKWQKLDYVNGKATWEEFVLSEEGSDKSFLSVWYDKSQAYVADWLATFVNATEETCSIEDLDIDDTELYRYLGFDISRPDAYLLDFIQRLKQEALSICVPRFGYRLLPGEAKDKRSVVLSGQTFTPDGIIVRYLRDSDFFATIVASVGAELDKWITEKRSGGDVMEAFVADALGSTIVEAIVSWGLSRLAAKMGKLEFKISNSYSPGYCGWDVAEQRLFFSLLPDKFCGISLTDSCLMLPIKSVSALVGIGKNVEKKPYGCAICRKKDCFKRKEVRQLV